VTTPAKTVQTKIDPAQAASFWNKFAHWLTPKRIRAQAAVLALCLWGVCAVDFATPGLVDRAGNIKFQDFLPLYISSRLIAQGHATDLYNPQITADAMQVIIGQPISAQPISAQPGRVRLPFLYGPQVGLFFLPVARFSFPVAARIWVAVSLLVFTACIYLLWKTCPNLRPHSRTILLCAVAFPPLFHFLVRGQLSALVLACFTAAFLAFRADRKFLAGVALGFLVFKPQFLVAIPLILLLAHAWKAFAGLVLAATAQLAITAIYFGPAVMRAYSDSLWHLSRVIDGLEPGLAPIQMHSLRSFWTLLIPLPPAALALYVLSSIVVICIAAAVWKSSSPLALRFSALTLAAVLANPHLFVYDLLMLAPVLLLLMDWTLLNLQPASSPTLQVLLYLVFVLPLFGPLSRWTHLQLSVPAFAALLWVLWRQSAIPSRKLASHEAAVV
jgi:hypothetical protein